MIGQKLHICKLTFLVDSYLAARQFSVMNTYLRTQTIYILSNLYKYLQQENYSLLIVQKL